MICRRHGLRTQVTEAKKGSLELGREVVYLEGRGGGLERHGRAPERESPWVLHPKGL